MKCIFPRALVWLVAGWSAASGLHAQSLPQLENDYRNIFSLQPSTQWPPPTTLDDGVATPGQFRNGSVFGGWQTHRLLDGATVKAGASTDTPGETTLIYPAYAPVDGNGAPITAATVQMTSAVIGRSIVLREPTVFFGDAIARPSVDHAGQPVDSVASYLPEPDNIVGGLFYYSPDARTVYATQPGTIAVTWRFRDPAHVPATLTLTYTVSSAPAPGRETRRIFWTEKGFKGKVIPVPEGPISQVNVRYSSLFPATVPTEYVSPYDVEVGVGLSAVKNTFWFSSVDRSFHAYNREGRVFVEFLGAEDRTTGRRQYLGNEIVEVIRELNPAVVPVIIGNRILPHDGDTTLEGDVVNGILTNPAFVHQQPVPSKDEIHFYATRTTTPTVPAGQPTGEIVFFWLRKGILDIKWPHYYDTYVCTWPEDDADYTLFARQDSAAGDSSSTGVILDSSNNPALIFQDDPSGQHAVMQNGNLFYSNVTVTDPEGRTLIRHSNGESVWFERVLSRLDTEFESYHEALIAHVGDRIEPPVGYESAVGYIRMVQGKDFDPTAYADPFVEGYDAARQGAIIPVNARVGHDDLNIWWYKKSQAPAGVSGIAANLWPVTVQSYKIEWSETPDKIVLASNAGSGELPSHEASGSIYYQNDISLPGFNPNDEHALMLAGRAYALRDDLGTEDTSLPYVLLRYTALDGRPGMHVFQVLREDTDNDVTFKYAVEAGRVLQAPMPIPLLSTVYRSKDVPASEEVQPAKEDTPPNAATPQHYRRFTYTDRKGTPWLYRGPHDGEAEKLLQMRYYYPAQNGFFIPGLALTAQPKPGDPMPYLREMKSDGTYAGAATGLNAAPLSIGYVPAWPANAPTLLLGETLGLPIRGLPAVRGQTSLEVLYDQAIANSATKRSAILHDPTVAKKSDLNTHSLSAIPASVYTNSYRGKIYFPKLPPHLVSRVYFDSNIGTKGSLVLLGQFIDEALGEDYFLLNVLNEKDRNDLKDLCNLTDSDRGKWNNLVDGLKVNLNMKVEDAEKQGTYVLAKDADSTKNTKIWNWISPRDWHNSPGVPTASSLRSGATLTILQDVNVGIQWLEDNYSGLVSWKKKIQANALANGIAAEDLQKLTSSFTTHDRPTRPSGPPYVSGFLALFSQTHLNRVISYNNRLAEFNRRDAVHTAFKDWILSNDRAWSSPAGKALTKASFDGVDFPTVNDNPADKNKAWKWVASNRSALELWDLGRTAPTSLPEIENALRESYFAAENAASVSVSVGQLAKVPNLNTAVDSYALTADGGGEGWVVLMAGNSPSLSPEAEPVSINILRVSKPLGRGELKVIKPTNPLSEKVTLQHSLDFAANPAAYDFEWRTLPPVDGQPPTVYTFVGDAVFGPGTWTTTALDGTTDTVILPGQIFANNGDDTSITKLTRSFNLTLRPFAAYLSLDLGEFDGVRLFVNGSEIARKGAAGFSDSSTTTPPLPSFTPLAFAYEVPVSLLKTGVGATNANVIEVRPETTADIGAGTRLDFRLEVVNETSVADDWNIVSKLPEETDGLESGSVNARNRYIVEGNSIFTLTDNYFICRYRARDALGHAAGSEWSRWTDPQLAEGWIKRVLDGINPFEQRVTDLYNNEVNSDVSLVTQAGKRWEGDIALNLENINDFGLIEIYETVLRRGKSLSIEGAPGINYGPANDALLLAAGYLSDLYMLLGNEAYADAANPTIAFSTDDGEVGDVATSLFAFKGQLPSVLDEELGLLRGRDDFLTPGTRVTPLFNRMVWNYTQGIDSGEAVYALNYNIRDLDRNGAVNANDAIRAYPQGHGDAIGHYLTSLTGYYGLLWNENFDWIPRTEAVLVLGKPVAVDYLDERKFATAAAAWTRSVAQVTELTYRQSYVPASATAKSWSHLADGRTNTSTLVQRRWGVDDWAVRGGQGAFFHWLTANSTLPDVDPNPAHEGIQKIDRTTVPELAEIVSQNEAVQRALDTADAQLNPLGLSAGAVPFDIDPNFLIVGSGNQAVTHFEQIYARALVALQNAVSAFDNAKSSTQFLRRQENSVAELRDAIDEQERAYEAQLIELYGTPYPEDIGPGKTYTQGYDGPDLVNFMYSDTPELFHDFKVNGLNATTAFEFDLKPEFRDSDPTKPIFNKQRTTFNLTSAGEFLKPGDFTSRRAVPGAIQAGISDVLSARVQLRNTLEDYSRFQDKMKRLIDVYEASVKARNDTQARKEKDLEIFSGLRASIFALETFVGAIETQEKGFDDVLDAINEAFPKSVGLASDVTAPARGIKKAVAAVKSFIKDYGAFTADIAIRAQVLGMETRTDLTDIEFDNYAWSAENAQWLHDLRASFQEMADTSRSVDEALRGYDGAVRELRSLTGQGLRILDEREVFRQKSAALIQGYRTKDFGFRAFRNEALESYKSLFDLAARYTYLTAQAYDYETGLVDSSGSATARDFMQKIVRARALGIVADGVPQPAGSQGGDPGLSGALARMNTDWAVVKSRFGFTNPDFYHTTFSLRRELKRIIGTEDGDVEWQDYLASCRMSNLLDDADVRKHCLNLNSSGALAAPGFVIEFDTTITEGYNFFGKPLAGGDSTFSPTSFATKVRSSGIAFPGYIGMEGSTSLDGTLADSGATSPGDPVTAFSSPDALSATPYIYLIPAGVDSLRAPNTNVVRTWSIEDQAIPLPFDIGGASSTANNVLTGAYSLTESVVLRKHQAFRAVPDSGSFSSAENYINNRLIGRSAWNSRWKIVIPGSTLLNNPLNGMKTFEDTVKDILLHFQTYSYSGN